MIAAAQCDEPEGVKLRVVREMLRSPWIVLEVYDHLRTVPNLFSERDLGEKLLTELISAPGTIYTIDDVGIIFVAPEGHVHITFWDRRLRGREGLCRMMCRIVMERQGFRGLTTAIPLGSKPTLAFAKRVGFREVETRGAAVLLRITPTELHNATKDGQHGS